MDLRRARGLSIANGVNHYVGFDVSGWTIKRRDSPSDVAVEVRRELPNGIDSVISAWDFEFEPTGAGLAAYQCDLWDADVTVIYRVRVILATGTATVRKL